MRIKLGIVGLIVLCSVMSVARAQTALWIVECGGWFSEDSRKNNLSVYVAGTTPPYGLWWVNYHDRADNYKFYAYHIREFSVDVTPEGWKVALIKGSGLINNRGWYPFIVEAIDKAQPGTGVDEFHIQIYDVSTYPYRLIDASGGILTRGNINITMVEA